MKRAFCTVRVRTTATRDPHTRTQLATRLSLLLHIERGCMCVGCVPCLYAYRLGGALNVDANQVLTGSADLSERRLRSVSSRLRAFVRSCICRGGEILSTVLEGAQSATLVVMMCIAAELRMEEITTITSLAGRY